MRTKQQIRNIVETDNSYIDPILFEEGFFKDRKEADDAHVNIMYDMQKPKYRKVLKSVFGVSPLTH